MWDLIVLVPDHCLSFYISRGHQCIWPHYQFGSFLNPNFIFDIYNLYIFE